MDTQTYSQTDRWTDRRRGRLIDRWTDMQIEIDINRQNQTQDRADML